MSSASTDAKSALPAHVWVYADGAARGNPGPAAAGWVICAPGDAIPLAQGGLALGRRTNNEAEYLAATLGMQAALERGARQVLLRADSELMVRQLQGRYQVRNERLRPLYMALVQLTKRFEHFRVEHVPRAQNALADAEANRVLDEARAAL